MTERVTEVTADVLAETAAVVRPKFAVYRVSREVYSEQHPIYIVRKNDESHAIEASG